MHLKLSFHSFPVLDLHERQPRPPRLLPPRALCEGLPGALPHPQGQVPARPHHGAAQHHHQQLRLHERGEGQQPPGNRATSTSTSTADGGCDAAAAEWRSRSGTGSDDGGLGDDLAVADVGGVKLVGDLKAGAGEAGAEDEFGELISWWILWIIFALNFFMFVVFDASRKGT